MLSETGYIERMLIEHKELVARINKLSAYIYSPNAMADNDKIDFANLCIQLRGMRMYEEALRGRLINKDIVLTPTPDGFEYSAKLDIDPEPEPLPKPEPAHEPQQEQGGVNANDNE